MISHGSLVPTLRDGRNSYVWFVAGMPVVDQGITQLGRVKLSEPLFRAQAAKSQLKQDTNGTGRVPRDS